MNQSRSFRRRARSAAFFWGLFLLALTSWPKPPPIPVVSGIPNSDKGGHFLLYGIEAYLLYRAVAWPGRSRFSLARVLAIVGAMAAWGMADEAHQYWIPGRSMEAGDVAADVAGAVFGALIASLGTFSPVIPRSGAEPAPSEAGRSLLGGAGS
jgi:VanZ family protein